MKKFLTEFGAWMVLNILGVLELPIIIVTTLISYLMSFVILLASLFHRFNKNGFVWNMVVTMVIKSKKYYDIIDDNTWYGNYNLLTMFTRAKLLALGYTRKRTYELYNKLKEEGYIEIDA